MALMELLVAFSLCPALACDRRRGMAFVRATPVFAIVLLVAAANASGAGAQNVASLTEAEAVRLALARNPSIDGARAARVAARGLAEEAEFLVPDNPNVGFAYRSDGAETNQGTQELEAEISVPVWINGQRSARRAVAQAIGQQAEAEIEAAQWELAGRVRAVYWRAWQARALLATANERFALSDGLATSAEKLARSGQVRVNDVRDLQAEALADRQSQAERTGELQVAIAELGEAIGIDGIEPDQLEPPRPEEPAPPAEVDPQRRPDLRLLRRKAEAARADVDLQRRDAVPNPEPSVGFRRERGQRNEPWQNTVRLGVSIPIPVVNRNQRAIAAALAERGRAESDLATAFLRARRELGAAAADWRAAWVQWQEADKAKRTLEENLRVMERAFALGEIGALDLVLEKRRWEQAAEAERRALGQLALARAAWETAQGDIGLKPYLNGQ
jgi:outer membrane protein, heavy metal efflux system